MTRAFLHLTVETGHVRLSPRGEVAGDVLRTLQRMVAEAIRCGQPGRASAVRMVAVRGRSRLPGTLHSVGMAEGRAAA